MALREQIIKDVREIADLQLLNQLFEYVQLIKKAANKLPSNKDMVLSFAGTLSDEDADQMRRTINEEFNKVEGDW